MSDPAETTQGQERAFLRPGGFSAHAGPLLGEGARLRSLTGLFVSELLRGAGHKLALGAALLPGLGMAIYVIARSWLADKATGGNVTINGQTGLAKMIGIAGSEQATFIVTNISLLFAFLVGWLLLFQLAFVAPIIAQDTRAGALLLYFSRPVRRSHYLLARVGAATLVGAAALCVPSWIALAAHALTMGASPRGSALREYAWASWPLLALGTVLSATIIALLSSLLALATGAILRSPSLASLIYGGMILGSIGASWIMQLAWGRNSLARAADLHHALSAPLRLGLMGWEGGEAPNFALLEAATSWGVWMVLGVVAWLALSRFIANPPLGRGRS